ncbi:coiled-coil domain-containing protein 43-like [Uloborus diversus]|uniref:coiled-coil domain-containing protein 43-like n=1 Tax=Uloborus diversus TaxID=327109 RepID=UPI00240A1D5E|nr:coiled-coil domain-containing protein 43-like [Uloborus diversus]
MEGDFTNWLSAKLRDVHIDDDVLGSYLSSIITSDEPENEKKETIQDLLLGYSEDVESEQLCCEIIDRWQQMKKKSCANKKEEGKIDIVDKVALIMEKQAQPVQKTINRSTEDEKLREAILTRCTYFSSEEEEEHSEEETVSSSKAPCQNQNAQAVIQAERDKRELQKLETEKKKVQDKANREKQKSKQDERREKERKRTQKREHRR